MITDELFKLITEKYTADQLKEEASRLSYNMSSPLTLFHNFHRGTVGYLLYRKIITAAPELGLDVNDDVAMAMVERLLRHYGIPSDWIPPTAILRESLALAVQQRRLLAALDHDVASRTIHDCIYRIAGNFESVADVYKLPHEDIERLARNILPAAANSKCQDKS